MLVGQKFQQNAPKFHYICMYPHNCKLFSTTRPFSVGFGVLFRHTTSWNLRIHVVIKSTLVYALLRFTNLQLTRFTFCPFWLFATNTQRIIFHPISLLLYELYTTPKCFLLYLYQYFKILSVRGSC